MTDTFAITNSYTIYGVLVRYVVVVVVECVISGGMKTLLKRLCVCVSRLLSSTLFVDCMEAQRESCPAISVFDLLTHTHTHHRTVLYLCVFQDELKHIHWDSFDQG